MNMVERSRLISRGFFLLSKEYKYKNLERKHVSCWTGQKVDLALLGFEKKSAGVRGNKISGIKKKWKEKKNEKKTSKRGTIRSLAELSLHRRLQPRPICLPFCDDPS